MGTADALPRQEWAEWIERIRSIGGDKHALIAKLSFVLAKRASDVLALRKKDLALGKDHNIRVFQPKTKRATLMPLPADIRAEVETVCSWEDLRPVDLLFPGRTIGRGGRRTSVPMSVEAHAKVVRLARQGWRNRVRTSTPKRSAATALYVGKERIAAETNATVTNATILRFTSHTSETNMLKYVSTGAESLEACSEFLADSFKVPIEKSADALRQLPLSASRASEGSSLRTLLKDIIREVWLCFFCYCVGK